MGHQRRSGYLGRDPAASIGVAIGGNPVELGGTLRIDDSSSPSLGRLEDLVEVEDPGGGAELKIFEKATQHREVDFARGFAENQAL